MADEKEQFHLSINKKQYEWPEQFIDGSQIKNLAGSPQDWIVNEKVPGPGPDPEIQNGQSVDLSPQASPHGEKKFTTRKPTTSPGA